MEIQTVGVVGCGIMGGGIAQVAATNGFDALVVETDQGRLDYGLAQIHGRLARDLEKGRLSQEDHDAIVGRIHGSTALADLSDRDIIIEAIMEDLEVKKPLFRELGEICDEKTILASNTSSLSLSALAGVSGRPDRVIGLHFFNPPTALKLVEIIIPSSTSEEVINASSAFCDAVGRVTIRVQDTPGFVVNRLLIPYIYDAVRLVESGVATAEDIDLGCRTGLGHTMGPLATADLVGLDTMASIGDAMFEEFGESRFKPPVLLRRLVSLGHLGRKSGRGFFDYTRKEA